MIRIMVDASIKSLLSEEFGVSVQFVRAALNFKRGGDKAIAIRRAALERGEGKQTAALIRLPCQLKYTPKGEYCKWFSHRRAV
ncbi:hypothetical protein [Porphyromonas gingivalis]|nr:hypothetical protein [Porphyromonas gingivalis]